MTSRDELAEITAVCGIENMPFRSRFANHSLLRTPDTFIIACQRIVWYPGHPFQDPSRGMSGCHYLPTANIDIRTTHLDPNQQAISYSSYTTIYSSKPKKICFVSSPTMPPMSHLFCRQSSERSMASLVSIESAEVASIEGNLFDIFENTECTNFEIISDDPTPPAIALSARHLAIPTKTATKKPKTKRSKKKKTPNACSTTNGEETSADIPPRRSHEDIRSNYIQSSIAAPNSPTRSCLKSPSKRTIKVPFPPLDMSRSNKRVMWEDDLRHSYHSTSMSPMVPTEEKPPRVPPPPLPMNRRALSMQHARASPGRGNFGPPCRPERVPSIRSLQCGPPARPERLPSLRNIMEL